ncbi:MAG: CHASE2 domain-containing protein [Armatimonadota bacterium]
MPNQTAAHRRQRRSHFLAQFGVGTAVGLLVLLLVHQGYLQTWNLTWTDALFSTQIDPPSKHLKLITVMEDDFGRWGAPRLPEIFPRDMLAALVGRLAAARPTAICLDVLLVERTSARDDDLLRRAIEDATDRGVAVIIAAPPPGTNEKLLPGYAPPAIPGAVSVRRGPRHEVRWLLPRYHSAEDDVPSMAVLAYEQQRRKLGSVGVLMAPPPVQAIPIRFFPRDQFGIFPVSQIVSRQGGTLPDEVLQPWLRDTIVIVGREDAACRDVHFVPVSPSTAAPGLERGQMYGVEVQANAVATLFARRGLRVGGVWLESAAAIVAAAIASLLVSLLGIIWGSLIALVVVMVAGSYASVQLFGATGHVLNLLPILLSVGLTGVATRTLEQRRLRSWLGAMVSDKVARSLGQQLFPRPGDGSIEDLVIFNFDLRRSSELGAQLKPEHLGPAINELMALVSKEVLDQGGIVNKYLGDGLLAFWPPQKHSSTAPQQGLAAALAVRDSLQGMAAQWRETVGHELRFASVVHYGPAWLGFVGVPHRLEYTALGGNVNDCFKLQEIASETGAPVIISKQLLEALDPESELAVQVVRWRQGRLEDLVYFELIPESDAVSDKTRPGSG